MMIKKRFWALSVVSAMMAGQVFAEAKPFGMELNHYSESSFKKRFKNATPQGENLYSHGAMYSVPTSALPLERVKEDTFIFDDKHRLVGVLLTLPKSKFDSIYAALNGKYQLVSKQIPFVGNKSATYREGASQVFLEAPHLSFDMTLNYLTDDIYQEYQRQQAEKKRAKAQQTQNAL